MLHWHLNKVSISALLIGMTQMFLPGSLCHSLMVLAFYAFLQSTKLISIQEPLPSDFLHLQQYFPRALHACALAIFQASAQTSGDVY